MLQIRRNWKKLTITMILLTVLGLLFLTTISAGLAQTTYYQLGMKKGTELFTVEIYDGDEWLASVGNSSNPSDWFGGDANITGAQSKFTTTGWSTPELATNETLVYMILRPEQIPFLFALADYGYNETEINEYFPDTYPAWYGLQSEWYFTVDTFEEQPNSTITQAVVIADPADYKPILDNYNAFVAEIQNISSGVPPLISGQFTNITADDFLWQFAFRGFTTAIPIESYLTELIDTLEPENATSVGNRLIFDRTGVTDYTVEFVYGSRGTISGVVVKNQAEVVIYSMTSSNSDWIFYTLLSITVVAAIGLTIFFILRSRKIKRK